jgi:hypothetical protein
MTITTDRQTAEDTRRATGAHETIGSVAERHGLSTRDANAHLARIEVAVVVG